MPPVVFVDTSAFHALQNSTNEQEHAPAIRIAAEIEQAGQVLVTTDYVLDETFTLLRSALGHGPAVRFGRTIHNSELQVIQIDELLQREAWTLFERYSDKSFSFTDCTSFAVMRQTGITVAFTFDRHFQQMGFDTLPEKLRTRRK
jgi:uncharacterized protein